MRRSRSPFIALIGVLVVGAGLLGACQPPVGQPLTDPRDILNRSIASTGALRTATIRAEAQQRSAPDPEFGAPAGASGGTLEGEVDLAAGNWSIRAAGNDGAGKTAMMMVDETMYVQMDALGGAGRWMSMSGEGGLGGAGVLFGVPGNVPDYGAILVEALAGPTIRMELVGVEECSTGRCYRVELEIPPEATWPLISSLLGLDQMPGMAQMPPAEDLPTFSVAVLVDTADLHVVDLSGTGATQQTTVDVRLQLIETNQPVQIVAPPPALVDRFDEAIGGGRLDNVGAPIAEPEPVPVEPVGGEESPGP